MHLSDEAFEAVVEDAIRSIPAGFHRYLDQVVVDIEDMPDEAVCDDLGLDDPRGLLGLYQGVPLTERHVDAPYQLPERITIYRRNIERMCRTRRQMVEQIRKTVLHEVGHHFGLTEQHLRDLGFD
jgi:predicted Zn-dependent protease with MMP-like domain